MARPVTRRLPRPEVPSRAPTDNGSVKRSWDYKVDRAEEHLEELRANVAAYDRSRPYEAVCPNPPAPDATDWSFVMNFTEPPPGRLAIVFGDLLFNLRSALDHIAVAMAPPAQKRSAGFPLCDRDNGEDRKQFLRMTLGMPPRAVERIASLQPYAVQQRATRPGQIYNLSTLSALHNADKHRALSILAPGLLDPTVTWSWAHEGVGRFQPDLAGQDAEILTSAEIGTSSASETCASTYLALSSFLHLSPAVTTTTRSSTLLP